MPSESLGRNIFSGEVTAIGRDGFWLLCSEREYFVPYENYPVFKRASVEQIYDVQEVGPGQLHWESLDADIEIAALEHPERFPLRYAA